MSTSKAVALSDTTKINSTGIELDVDSPTHEEEHMLEFLNGGIIGQSEACQAAVRIKTRALSVLKRNGCAGFYAFQGEPGVGKTELVKMICKYIHNDPMAFVLIDGGLLQDDHQAATLTGAPPAYVGYEDPEKAAKRRKAEEELLDKLRKENPILASKYKTFNPRKLLSRENLVKSRGNSKVPLTVVFIDEADKMHARIDDLLLNAVVNGVMMMTDNEMVDVSDVIFIIAGNHGSAQVVMRKAPIGFNRETVESAQEASREIIEAAMKARHRPEFLDRIDEVIFFNKLQPEDLKIITTLRMDEVVARFQEVMPRGTAFTVKVETSARDFIFDRAMENAGNARRIGRMVQKYFTDRLDRLITKMRSAEMDVTVDDLVTVSHTAGKDALTFIKFEDQGVPADGDHLIQVRPDTPVAQIFLAKERNRKTLKLKARGSSKKVYKVVIPAESKEEMASNFAMFAAEVREILELEVVSFEMGNRAPWNLTLYVECTVDQSRTLVEHFDHEGTVTLTDREPSAA